MSMHPAIILVEDDPAVLQSLTFWLQTEGHTVLAFDSAEKLLASPLPERGVFVLDQGLGHTTGLELLARLRERGVAFPAVLVASQVDEAVRRSARRHGIELIQKPTISDELLTSLNALLARAGEKVGDLSAEAHDIGRD